MTGVALGAGADGAVLIWLSDGVALLASCGDGWMPFGDDKRIWRAFGCTGLELLAEGDLFRLQALLSVDGCPAWRGVPAAQVLLVDALMAGAAVAGGEMRADDEAVVIDLFLSGGGLVAIEAVNALFGVGGHLVLMNNGVLKTGMALGALAGGTNEICCRLLDLYLWPRTVDQKRREDERKGDDDSNKNRSEGHRALTPRE